VYSILGARNRDLFLATVMFTKKKKSITDQLAESKVKSSKVRSGVYVSRKVTLQPPHISMCRSVFFVVNTRMFL